MILWKWQYMRYCKYTFYSGCSEKLVWHCYKNFKLPSFFLYIHGFTQCEMNMVVKASNLILLILCAKFSIWSVFLTVFQWKNIEYWDLYEARTSTIISVMNRKTIDVVLMISDPIFGCMRNCGIAWPISVMQMHLLNVPYYCFAMLKSKDVLWHLFQQSNREYSCIFWPGWCRNKC